MIYSIPTEILILYPHCYTSDISYDVGDWLNFFTKPGSCFCYEIERKNKTGDKYEYFLK